MPEQSAIWYLAEHVHGFCGESCPLRTFSDRFKVASDQLICLRESPISNAIDWARGEMLGYLCDMFEPPGRLFTPEHRFVQIDNELMFTAGSADLWECRWLKTTNNEWSVAGLEEARQLCDAVADLPDRVFAQATAIPQDYALDMRWDVPRQARGIREKAKSFLAELGRSKAKF